MADVLLTSTEEIIQLVSVSGASQGDITTAVTAHNASTTAHGLNANIFAALTGAASPSAGNVLVTASGQPLLTLGTAGATNGQIILASHDREDYAGVVFQADFSGHPDPVLFHGYNPPNSTGYSSAEQSIYTGYEGYYWVGAGTQYTEWYVEYKNPGATVTRRPFMAAIDIATNLTTVYVYANSMIFGSSDSVTNYWQIVGGASQYNIPLQVVGSSDAIQLLIKGNATQTGNIFEVQDSGGGAVFSVDKVGRIGAGAAITATSEIRTAYTYAIADANSVTGIDLTLTRNDATGANNYYGFAQSMLSNANTADSHITAQYGLAPGMSYAASVGRTLTVDAGGGLLVTTPSMLGVGTKVVTTQSGVRIQNQGVSGIATAYGLYIETQANAATNIPLYVQSGSSWFGGSIGVGINPALDPIQVLTSAPGAGEVVALSLSGSGFGDTVGGAESIAWRYKGGSTVLGSIKGIVVSGGMELVFNTYISSLGERLRIGSATITAQTDINVASTKVYKVNSVQVVGAQGAAVADATGAGDVVAQLNALLARCRAHGLIAT